MFDDNLFLEDERDNIKVTEYVKEYARLKDTRMGYNLTVYSNKITQGLGFLVSNDYIVFNIHKVDNKEGYFTLQVACNGFPTIKGSTKERTIEQVSEYIEKYFLVNEQTIKDILQ